VGDADFRECLDGRGEYAQLGEAQLDRGLASLGDLYVALLLFEVVGLVGIRLVGVCAGVVGGGLGAVFGAAGRAVRVEVLWTYLLSWRGRVQDGALLVRVLLPTSEAGRDRTGRTPR
jgi:hypothetical protein